MVESRKKGVSVPDWTDVDRTKTNGSYDSKRKLSVLGSFVTSHEHVGVVSSRKCAARVRHVLDSDSVERFEHCSSR